MTVSYFPGCTLRNKARDLDTYARRSAEALGVTLREIDDWQCCGGVFTSTSFEIGTKLASVRALRDAGLHGEPLVTVCSACHNVIKQTNHAMRENREFSFRVNNYLGDEAYDGQTEVIHYLELLRDKVGYDQVAARVTNPLTGRKVASYYGCLLLRPGSVMAMDDPENPSIMEDLMKALGATPVRYAMRNECCGAYVTMESPELAGSRSLRVIENAKAAGAEMIVTACPLCMYNLRKCGTDMPIVYITELLAEALGVKEAADEK